MDALSQTLRVVRLVGAIFINAKFTAPWAYQSPEAATAAPLLEPGPVAGQQEAGSKICRATVDTGLRGCRRLRSGWSYYPRRINA